MILVLLAGRESGGGYGGGGGGGGCDREGGGGEGIGTEDGKICIIQRLQEEGNEDSGSAYVYVATTRAAARVEMRQMNIGLGARKTARQSQISGLSLAAPRVSLITLPPN